jgi:hypothetical protein
VTPAEKLIPQLITGNVTKHPRRIDDLVAATGFPLSAVRACLRRLGESDRAIVRPLDQQQETWEISHDFLVPLLDAIVARRTLSLWRRLRPWLPWIAAAVLGIAAIAIPRMTSQNSRAALVAQGWAVREDKNMLMLAREDPIPPKSMPIVRALAPPLSLDLEGTKVADISALRELENLETLNLKGTKVRDVSALRELRDRKELNLDGTCVKDVSSLRELKTLRIWGPSPYDCAP